VVSNQVGIANWGIASDQRTGIPVHIAFVNDSASGLICVIFSGPSAIDFLAVAMRRTRTRRRSSSILQMRLRADSINRQNSAGREPRRACPILRGSSSSARRFPQKFQDTARAFAIELAMCGEVCFYFKPPSPGHDASVRLREEWWVTLLAAANAVEVTLGDIQSSSFASRMLEDGFART